MTIALFILLLIAAAYGTVMVYLQTSFLHDHSKYVHDRDAVWAPMIDHIEHHLKAQDADAAMIKSNQHKIMDKLEHIEKHR